MEQTRLILTFHAQRALMAKHGEESRARKDMVLEENHSQVQLQLHYTTLHYTALHYTTLTTLHYTTLHYTTLHYTTLRYTKIITLYYTTLHYNDNYNYTT